MPSCLAAKTIPTEPSNAMIVAGWWIAARLTHSLERLTAYARNVRDGRPAGLRREVDHGAQAGARLHVRERGGQLGGAVAHVPPDHHSAAADQPREAGT